MLCDRAIERVQQRAEHHGKPMVLIGWSLGGVVARECARELPDQVAQVITFGTPVVGGPKYSAAAPLFRRRNMDLDWIEQQISKRDQQPIEQPITIIYSKSDGIVGWQASIDQVSPKAHHIEIDAAHLGMGFNRQVWQAVANSLASAAQTRAELANTV